MVTPKNTCLIIGGGVIGLSLAYELSHRKVSVTIVERGEFGKEASWAGAGILPPAMQLSDAHPYDQLRGLSFSLHRDWANRLASETSIDTGYRVCGGLYLARSAGESAALIGMADFFEGEGVFVERLTLADLQKREPGLSQAITHHQIKHAFLLPHEAQLRNPRYLQALTLACRQRGVRMLDRVEVSSFEALGGRVTQVNTNRGMLVADQFCVTSGAWTQSLLEKVGIVTGILPIRGQMMLFSCPSPPLRCILNEGPRYMVPRDDGHFLVGATEEEAGFEKINTEAAIQDLSEFAYSLLPSLRAAVIERTWAGLRPGTFDGFPYLGPVPGFENMFVAAGHFRSGLYLSPGTAVTMAQLLCGEKPCVDLYPFRVSRG